MYLLGALGTTYRVIWGISSFDRTWKLQNILVDGTYHPHHQHQGTEGVCYEPNYMIWGVWRSLMDMVTDCGPKGPRF